VSAPACRYGKAGVRAAVGVAAPLAGLEDALGEPAANDGTASAVIRATTSAEPIAARPS
jgi:hypothetical protein